MNSNSSSVRQKIAREAATLLYFGLEKEYKQAKLKAAANIGVHVLPTNLEVALELDQIAEENEGAARTERLIQMRTEALKIMKLLKAYCPVLIGSVWRGTIRRGSDIDIAVYSDEPEEVVAILREHGLKISRVERVTVAKHGKPASSLHIHVATWDRQNAEIVVRDAEEAGKKRVCETFGDEIKGLRVLELEKLLKENPAQRFIPS